MVNANANSNRPGATCYNPRHVKDLTATFLFVEAAPKVCLLNTIPRQELFE
jgi:hypothetical protein